jgi:hypothetical protein
MDVRNVMIFVLTVVASGCGGSPGQLKGTWKADGIVPMTVTFRSGETEAMGVIEHVDYRTQGNTVEVIYKDGLMKGSSMEYVLVDRNTATNPMLTLHRVR